MEKCTYMRRTKKRLAYLGMLNTLYIIFIRTFISTLMAIVLLKEWVALDLT
jgi:hypothetical protein